MAFRGLFVGIDKYTSPLIGDLTCSARDARALYGLFADSLGQDHCVLLTNGGATRDTLLGALDVLAGADPSDLVFIHFSGHGSDTHHLVTHDADPLDLDHSAIRLEELVEKFTAIPARNVILSLDCCFAGGAGSKVFHSPTAPRDPASVEALLRRIGGAGRVILTASGADQAAIEDRRRGHGVFSYYLAEGLKGAPEVVEAGSIPFLALAHFVTGSVEAAAAVFRHVQQPALRGTLDGEVRLPVLVPGVVFGGFFPETPTARVTDDLITLGPYGFSPDMTDRLRQSIPGLNRLQQEAVNDMNLFKGEHLVVSAPTSSGKTMIGELAALRAHLRGERTYMLLPLRALVNDKYEDLRQKYAPLGLRVIRSTGEIADDNDALMRGKFDIALLTYERFTALAVVAPFLLRNVGLIVVDEVQMITDQGRGANLEFLLTYLRAQRALGIEPQLVALSAVIGDTNGFDRWLGARLLSSTERPVPLEEGTLSLGGEFHYIATDGSEQRSPQYVTPEYRKGSSQDVIIPLVRQLVVAGEKVIVFRETKPIVRSTALYLAGSLGLQPAAQVLRNLPQGDPSAASASLRQALGGGVAFHNADLDREEREAVEVSFRDPNGEVKVLVATTTLAMGVNTPAWSVVIEGLSHPGDVPYSVAEYKNMVGRAGRLGWSPTGKAFLVAPSPGDEYRLWHSYVRGHPEALHSRFAEQDVLTAVCRVLGTAAAAGVPGLTEEEAVDFLRSTFAAFVRGEPWSPGEIRSAIQRLAAAGLAEEMDGRLRLTALGEVAGQLGIAVESVVRIASALRGVPLTAMRSQTVLAVAQATVELDDVFIPIHRRSHQERARWQGMLHQQQLPQSVISALHNAQDVQITARCKRLAAVLMWTQGIDLSQLEASLLQHLPADNAAGPIRSVADRTRDLVGIVAKVGQILNPGKPEESSRVAQLSDDLAVQLELGVPVDMVWLAMETKRLLSRGEYLALFRSGVREASQLTAMDPATLEGLVPDARRRASVLEAAARITARQQVVVQDLPMPAPPTD
jgi:helicase